MKSLFIAPVFYSFPSSIWQHNYIHVYCISNLAQYINTNLSFYFDMDTLPAMGTCDSIRLIPK